MRLATDGDTLPVSKDDTCALDKPDLAATWYCLNPAPSRTLLSAAGTSCTVFATSSSLFGRISPVSSAIYRPLLILARVGVFLSRPGFSGNSAGSKLPCFPRSLLADALIQDH